MEELDYLKALFDDFCQEADAFVERMKSYEAEGTAKPKDTNNINFQY